MTSSPRSYRVEWAIVAQRDLQTIIETIAVDDPLVAAKVLHQIESRAVALNRMPGRGRVLPELAAMGIHTYRELIISPWRLVYRISETAVYVLAVFDGRRNMEDILLERLLR